MSILFFTKEENGVVDTLIQSQNPKERENPGSGVYYVYIFVAQFQFKRQIDFGLYSQLRHLPFSNFPLL